MNISNYPGNAEIATLEKAVSDSKKAYDWRAVYHTRIDLAHEIQKREEWIKENVV